MKPESLVSIFLFQEMVEQDVLSSTCIEDVDGHSICQQNPRQTQCSYEVHASIVTCRGPRRTKRVLSECLERQVLIRGYRRKLGATLMQETTTNLLQCYL